MKYLWSFYWDCGRSGSVDGLFVATEEQVKKAIGERVSFGEILGKHSDVCGTLDECDVNKVDLKPETVEEVSVILGDTWSGYNPLDYIYIYCEECGGEWELSDNMEFKHHEDVKVCEDCYNKLSNS